MSSAPVFEAAEIEKSFGAASVLRGVGLRLARGEVHAVLGENGAGKSTLMKVLLGIERADAGTMRLDGQVYAPRGPRDARESGVVMVPQERTLCPDLSVFENIVLGLEPTVGPLKLVQRSVARAQAERALGLVTGPDRRIPLDVRARHLGVADQQLVEIARALAQVGRGVRSGERESVRPQEPHADRARVLILDEPTSSLGHDDAGRLFARIQTLKSSGLAIILVTHFLGDVSAHADRYTVLRDGKVQSTGDPKVTPTEQIVQDLLGRELEASRREPTSASARPAGEVLLEVTDLAGVDRPRRASFTLHRGEILGVAGLVGSGRTELLRMIAGLDEPQHGSIERRAAKGIGLLSEDRGGEGLMLSRSIAENVTLSRRGPLFALPSRLLAVGAEWIKSLGIKSDGPDQPVLELSGGNQQKVQVARLLREDYDVLLIDEPTRGIDVAAKAQVLALLRELADQGKGIVLVSSQLEELVSTCDKICVLKRGELGPKEPASKWTEEGLLLEASS